MGKVIDDNHVPKASKNSDYSTITREEDDTNYTPTSRVNVKHVSISTNDQVKGGALELDIT